MSVSVAARMKERPRQVLWGGLALWLGLLGVAGYLATRVGPHRFHVAVLLGGSVLTLMVATLLALAGLRRVPIELRALRVLAVVAPAAVVVAVEVILYLMAIHGMLSEVTQHVVATAVLSLGAVPFAIYVFRAFSRLRDELRDRVVRLQVLHATSLTVTRAQTTAAWRSLVLEGARRLARADRAVLRLREAGPDAATAGGGTPDGFPGGPGQAPSTRHVALVGAGGGRLGTLSVERSDATPFDAQDGLLLEMFAVSAAAGLESVRRLEEAHLIAVVEERERIARDLHDDLGQLLGYLATKIQAIRQLLGRGRIEQADAEVARLDEAVRALGIEVREAILGLRAGTTDGRPLGQTLSDYVADFGVLAELDAAFEGRPTAGAGLPPSVSYEVLQIAREALANVRRHAGAPDVRVGLAETEGAIELTVSDHGVGFDPRSDVHGFGLKTMAERARGVGGRLEIDSGPGAGTRVRVRVPLPATGSER